MISVREADCSEGLQMHMHMYVYVWACVRNLLWKSTLSKRESWLNSIAKDTVLVLRLKSRVQSHPSHSTKNWKLARVQLAWSFISESQRQARAEGAVWLGDQVECSQRLLQEGSNRGFANLGSGWSRVILWGGRGCSCGCEAIVPAIWILSSEGQLWGQRYAGRIVRILSPHLSPSMFEASRESFSSPWKGAWSLRTRRSGDQCGAWHGRGAPVNICWPKIT